MYKVNLSQKFSLFSEHWRPKIVGELNEQYVKLARLQGEFVWHQHKNEDELFLVVHGQIRILFRDHEIALDEGEFLIVPRGVEHKPVADQEACVLLLEPRSTLNTGSVRAARTVDALEWI
jgi:mannose-6-phosphate isomerase-like protein (cupin superfamily)